MSVTLLIVDTLNKLLWNIIKLSNIEQSWMKHQQFQKCWSVHCKTLNAYQFTVKHQQILQLYSPYGAWPTTNASFCHCVTSWHLNNVSPNVWYTNWSLCSNLSLRDPVQKAANIVPIPNWSMDIVHLESSKWLQTWHPTLNIWKC